ncbi:MAG: protease inhibitor I42 family protein [Pyrinomonadaceae bacterium]
MPSTFQQEDNEISARAGETFIVELEGNPTTGYQWELSEGDEQFRMVEKDYAQPGSGIGAATKERFVIKALKPGSTALTFTYKRPWETEVLDTKTFRLDVQPE